jgi:hypothetical protein
MHANMRQHLHTQKIGVKTPIPLTHFTNIKDKITPIFNKTS